MTRNPDNKPSIELIRLVNFERKLCFPEYYYGEYFSPEQKLWMKRIVVCLRDAISDPNQGLYKRNRGTTNAQKAWLYFEGKTLKYPDGSEQSLYLDADAAGINPKEAQEKVLACKGFSLGRFKEAVKYVEDMHEVYKRGCVNEMDSLLGNLVPSS